MTAADPAALRAQVIGHLQAGELGAARALAARALAHAPDDAAAHELLATVMVASGDHAAARAMFTRAAMLAPGKAAPCFNAGALAEAQDDPDGAIAAYREALVRAPDLRVARLGLARTLQELDRRPEAIAAWRAVLELDPGDPSARHMIDALSGARTAGPPADFVARTFDAYAARFDRQLVEHLQYRGPALVRAALGDDRRYLRALDLGCGTGLAGAALRDRCDQLIGVDLSRKMIAQAEARAVYDALVVADVVDYLRTAADRFDLVIATDVLGYLGDLAPLFAALAPRLAGRFAFTVERADDGDFALQSTGRWAHGAGYVEALAGQHGLAVDTVATDTLRLDHGQPVAALVYVVSAPPAGSRG